MNATPETWVVTNHAAKRYCERVDKGMTPLAAMIALRGLLPLATMLPEPTFQGQQRWALPGVDAVVVAKPDPKAGAHVAVTVLGPHEMYEADAIPEVVAAYRRSTTPFVMAKPALVVAQKPTVTVAVKPAKPKSPSSIELERNAEISNLRCKVGNLQKHIDHTQGKVSEWKERALAAERKVTEASKEMSARHKKHHATMMAESTKRRDMLRIAVIALREAGDADTLSALEAIDTGITSDQFCYPERFTNEEREAAAASREAKEQGT